MKVTKYGFYLSVAIYMVALALFYDLPGNTVNTGFLSSVFLIKFIADLGLAVIAGAKFIEVARGHGSMPKATAMGIAASDDDLEVVGHGITDSAYYLIIVGYITYNLYYHFTWNAATTGIESMMYALWCVADAFLIGVAGHQAWMKFGGIEVKLRPVQKQ